MKYQADKCLISQSPKHKCIGQCVYHHINARQRLKADDSERNLMPLCVAAHTEVHTIGLSSFAKKYYEVRDFLTSHDWKWNGAKWWHHSDSRFRKAEFNNFN